MLTVITRTFPKSFTTEIHKYVIFQTKMFYGTHFSYIAQCKLKTIATFKYPNELHDLHNTQTTITCRFIEHRNNCTHDTTTNTSPEFRTQTHSAKTTPRLQLVVKCWYPTSWTNELRLLRWTDNFGIINCLSETFV